jgi:hypothetical protein
MDSQIPHVVEENPVEEVQAKVCQVSNEIEAWNSKNNQLILNQSS